MINGKIENYGLKNYLNIPLESTASVNRYQLECIKKNQFDFLLPIQVRIVNNERFLSYAIDRYESLDFFLKRKTKLTFKEFIQIINQMVEIILNKRQQLGINYFVLKKEYIYITRKDKKLKFILYPVKDQKEKFHDTLGHFIFDLMTKYVSHDKNNEFYSEMLDLVNEEHFNILLLRDLIQNTYLEKNKYEINDENEEVMSEELMEESSEKRILVDKKVKPSIKDSFLKDLKDASTKNDFEKRKITVIVMQVVFLLFMGLAIITLKGDIKKVVGAVVILLALDGLISYLALKKYLTEIKNRNKLKVRLEEKNGDHQETIYFDEVLEYQIGREETSDIVIKSKKVSGKHAKMVFLENRVMLEDLDSTNKTIVNNEILEANVQREIEDNDKIIFADREYIFRIIL